MNSRHKRQSSQDFASTEYNATHKRRDRISIQQNFSDFNSYPTTLRELASYRGPPARTFPIEADATEKTMSLDEYLHGSRLTFWDYLDLRYENSLRDIKQWSLRSGR
ncbi:hypothetical protein BDV38DRAFT_236165 [Aspergillus pseudotamarii]|uniref:Uncharacterized protein n=1 Tax=Aspergillus pseudotamarii TaxID=132259 RepID=A0A5N6T7R5_ASPPS|nr:uncharacterized protein BDV38DRAFT_236165 [Aspergillus pseudotamarii]KAE8142231.1 hypothetical protein BDV38DRAFT_236165 [Aspergillus pseudotamarii]